MYQIHAKNHVIRAVQIVNVEHLAKHHHANAIADTLVRHQIVVQNVYLMLIVRLNWLASITNVKIRVKDRVELAPNAMSLVTPFRVCAHHHTPVIHSYNVSLNNSNPSIHVSPAHAHPTQNVFIEMASELVAVSKDTMEIHTKVADQNAYSHRIARLTKHAFETNAKIHAKAFVDWEQSVSSDTVTKLLYSFT